MLMFPVLRNSNLLSLREGFHKYIKGVYSENQGGSEIAPIVGYWPPLVLNIFPFPVSAAKLISNFYNNRQSAANRCRASRIHLFPFCCVNTDGPAICAPPVGEAQQIKKNPGKLLIGAANLPCFAYRPGKCSLLHLLTARTASTSCPELAYNLGITGQKWKKKVKQDGDHQK
jgi:hypothetical protein